MAATQARLGILRLNAGRLNAAAASTPTAPTPAHGSDAGPFALAWTAAGGARYEVRFGTTPSPPLYTTTTSPSAALPPLVDGQVYYWQVVATGALGAPVAGPVWTFTARKPSVVALLSPSNGATNQQAPLTLTWTAVTNTTPVLYDVKLGTGALGVYAEGLAGTFYTVPTLASDVTYRWQIVARNNAGRSASPVWTFATRVITGFIATIGGVVATHRIRLAGFRVRDILTDTPNTAAFDIEGTAPTVGQDVRFGLGSLAPVDCLFAGRIDTVTATYEGVAQNQVWRVTCQDHTTGLNRRKVRRRYAQQSASAIAHDLRTRYAPSAYTGNAIAANLPVVEGGIDFTEEDLTECFSRLAQRIGGYWYVDYEKDVHCFLTEVTDAPTPLTRTARVLLNAPPVTLDTDATQIRTRVYVEGGGAQARAPVAPGATSLPVTDATWYPGTGGLVVSGPQRIAYSGKGAVGGPSAPTVAAAGDGALSGVYSWKYAHVVSGNENPLSAASAALAVFKVAPPASAPSAAPQVGSTYVAAPPYFALGSSIPVAGAGGLSPGTYEWASTYVLDNPAGGETPPAWSVQISSGNSSWWCRWEGFPTPPAPIPRTRRIYRTSANGGRSTARMVFDVPGNPAHHDSIITDSYTDDQRQMGVGPPPSTNTTVPNALAPGRVDWVVVFTTAIGETLKGPVATVTIGEGISGVQLTGIPTSPDSRVTGRRLYRAKRNAPTGGYFLEATLDATTTSYLSTMSDAALGAAYAGVDTSGPAGGATVANITTGPAGTTARRLYRPEAGGTVYKLVVVLNDNTTTTYIDTKSDAALGAVAAGETVLELTGIPASGPGAIVLDIAAGDEVNLLVQVDDVPAQQALAGLEGAPSDGIVEHYIQDRRLGAAQATAIGKADLVLFARPLRRVTYTTRDPKTRSGKTIVADLPELGIVGDFTIQTVDIDEVDRAPGLYPRYRVTASSVRFSLEDVIRRLQLEP